MKKRNIIAVTCLIIAVSFLISCGDDGKPDAKDIVRRKELLDDHVKDNLQRIINYASLNDGRLNDTLKVTDIHQLRQIYSENGHAPKWSSEGKWLPAGDSLYEFVKTCFRYGLFPSDYHIRPLSGIRELVRTDSLSAHNAVVWANADLLLSNAFLGVCKDIREGRIGIDSLAMHKDTAISESYYDSLLVRFLQSNDLHKIIKSLEPQSQEYTALKKALGGFLDSADFRRYTHISYPMKDSAALYALLQRRFFELDVLPSPSDTLTREDWKSTIRQYQKDHKLKATGKINESTVESLNNTDWEKFKSVALTMDKLKSLPDTMPSTYVWVNIPSFNMKVVDADSTVITSRIIVGAPKTRTPELNSEISNFITYPQWTVPYSIVFKEMLPKIKKDTGYLAKQNLMVVGKDDEIIDPATIDWSKLSKKHFPYQIRQREGDDNSLGVMKFNFRNKYSVYLHDTNARWLFGKADRALSHGCVRVQKWKDLANFLVRDIDERYPADTLAQWIARQEKHSVYGFERVPIFIRYLTCQPEDGKILFYDDIYGEDARLKQQYFSHKSIN